MLYNPQTVDRMLHETGGMPGRVIAWVFAKVSQSGGKLFVLADLRGVGPGPNGDPRRRSILRDATLWDQNKIMVRVQPTGMTYSPTEKSAGR